MNLGVCCEPLVERWGLERSLRFIADLEYDGIELALWDFAPMSRRPSPEATDRLARLAAQYEVEPIGIYRYFEPNTNYSITSSDARVRERTARYLADVIETCGAIGGQVVVFGSPEQRAIQTGISETTAFDNAVRTLSAAPIIEGLERHDVTLCIEPLTWKADFLTTAVEVLTLVESIAHPNVGVVLDGYHLVRESGRDSVPAIIRRCGPRLAHFHADDGRMCGPGFGDLDYRSILRTLGSIGYDGYLSVEIHRYFERPADRIDPAWLARSLEYLTSVG